MRLFDDKDVRIVAQAIESVGPENRGQRAELIIEAAKEAGVYPSDLIAMIKWMRVRDRSARSQPKDHTITKRRQT